MNAELVLSSSMTSLKLYAVSDTGKANDLLKGKTAMGSRYNVRLVPGYYILEGYNGTTFIGRYEDSDHRKWSWRSATIFT